MTRWALIENGRVINVTEQDAEPTVFGPWIECGDAGPGWYFDGEVFAPALESERP